MHIASSLGSPIFSAGEREGEGEGEGGKGERDVRAHSLILRLPDLFSRREREGEGARESMYPLIIGSLLYTTYFQFFSPAHACLL